MATQYYHYQDTGAPSIDGTVGSLVNALRALLVGTSGVAYGSTPSCGWTEPFTAASNVAVFRNNSVTGSGCYVRIDDNGPGAGGAKEARIKVYKSMTGLNTGTYVCPDSVSYPNGQYIRKSTTANSTARPWQAVGDGVTFYMEIDGATTSFTSASSNEDCLFGFGDYETHNAGDGYNFFCGARPSENTGIGSSGLVIAGTMSSSPSNNGLHCMATLVGSPTSSVAAIMCMPYASGGILGRDSGSGASDGVTNARIFGDGLLVHSTSIAGKLRGFCAPAFNLNTGVSATEITGVIGRPTGSVITVFKAYGGSSSGRQGATTIETSEDW